MDQLIFQPQMAPSSEKIYHLKEQLELPEANTAIPELYPPELTITLGKMTGLLLELMVLLLKLW